MPLVIAIVICPAAVAVAAPITRALVFVPTTRVTVDDAVGAFLMAVERPEITMLVGVLVTASPSRVKVPDVASVAAATATASFAAVTVPL